MVRILNETEEVTNEVSVSLVDSSHSHISRSMNVDLNTENDVNCSVNTKRKNLRSSNNNSFIDRQSVPVSEDEDEEDGQTEDPSTNGTEISILLSSDVSGTNNNSVQPLLIGKEEHDEECITACSQKPNTVSVVNDGDETSNDINGQPETNCYGETNHSDSHQDKPEDLTEKDKKTNPSNPKIVCENQPVDNEIKKTEEAEKLETNAADNMQKNDTNYKTMPKLNTPTITEDLVNRIRGQVTASGDAPLPVDPIEKIGEVVVAAAAPVMKNRTTVPSSSIPQHLFSHNNYNSSPHNLNQHGHNMLPHFHHHSSHNHHHGNPPGPPPPFRPVGNHMSQHLQFGFFGDPKYETLNPWGPFPPPPMAPLAPPGVNPSMPTTPLPTAMIPLPLDPNCPPAVLPSFATTGSSQNSGFSTGGHSRSTSPMAHPQGPGQPLLGMESFASLPVSALLPTPASGVCAPGNNSATNPNFIFAAPSNELTVFPHFPTVPGQYVVYFHINPGVNVSFHVGDQLQVIKGPMTVPLVSTNSNPPIPLPMQVPPGHVVQQIVDENGTLRHVIVSHQPPIMPIPAYAPGNQSQPFYPPGPGFPGAHFSPMQPGSVPCGVPTQGNSWHHQGNENLQKRNFIQFTGPATPPAPNILGHTYVGACPIPPHVQKDERIQRQYVKLRRKFEQKQQREVTSYTPHYHQNGTLKKEESSYNTNPARRAVPNGTAKSEEDGSIGSTGSVTSTGTQDEEEETRVLAQTDMLSALIPPKVSDVTSRSAFVEWSHPDRFNESGENKFPDCDVTDNEIRFEVSISDRNRENKFKSIFVGQALSCKVNDLKPGSLYAINYCAMLGDVRGNPSTPTSFSTLPAEPDPPTSPRAISRNRSSIQFKWSPPANDNGSKVTNYVMEYDEGKGGSHFVEIYKGKNKQCTVPKLQPAYSYQFRLAAINQVGQSRYSSVVSVMTSGSPPAQPMPPTLTEAGVTYLTLEWKGRPSDEEYTLQMEDPTSGHGFLCIYNGNAPHYTCIGLTRNSRYKFKVKAQNGEGHSKWSDEVILATLPDRPGPPHKPGSKGRVHAYSFKVRWDAPSDDGGVPISMYALQIDQGNGGFEEIYRGREAEYNVDKLSPGQSYALRVIAIGKGGDSDPSEPCVITTEPVCPGKCHIPRILGKPKSNSVHLKWSPPDWDGGSPINQYEVGCTTSDNKTQEAYRGKETDCFVNRLLPGRAYLFQIRAFNRIGAGPWSDPLEVVSGAGHPDSPGIPKVVTKTSHIAVVSWSEPLNNGSAITEYRVQMAQPSSTPAIQFTEDDAADQVMEISSQTVMTSFSQVYIGTAASCEVKGLQPACVYLFRVQAANSAGNSDWSGVTTHQMPASSPSSVTNVEAAATSDSISLTWATPVCNGSPIIQYNVMIGETVFVTTSTMYTLENLMPDTQYKIRVQAVNSVGPGAFSSVVKIATKPLPPPPPKLECVSAAHFWMKLKWSEVTNKSIEYLVQMISPYQDEFQVVYRGSNPNCKVTRLTEDTEYQFRICALNGAGQGPYSDMYRFCTLKAPPSQVKALRVEELKEFQLHRIEWMEVACTDTLEYQLQLAKRRDQDFKTIYRGVDRHFEIKREDIVEGMEYTTRVCAIRVCGDGTQLVGPYSNQVNFNIPLPVRDGQTTSKTHSSLSSKSNSASAQASNTLIHAIEEKMHNISYESRVGILAVFALIILAFVISLITHHVVSS